MSPTPLETKLCGILRDVFDDASLELRRDLTAGDVANWDSITHINLIVAVESAFGIRFTTREVQGLKNVGELIDLVEKKGRP